MVIHQSYRYFRLYPEDSFRTKALVRWVFFAQAVAKAQNVLSGLGDPASDACPNGFLALIVHRFLETFHMVASCHVW